MRLIFVFILLWCPVLHADAIWCRGDWGKAEFVDVKSYSITILENGYFVVRVETSSKDGEIRELFLDSGTCEGLTYDLLH